MVGLSGRRDLLVDIIFVIGTVADLAPTLKEAELRVLLELTRRGAATPNHWVRASSRELATACRVARSNVQPAIDALTARGLLTTRQGTATTAAAHQVNIPNTAKIGGPVTGPPPAKRWPYSEATVDLFQGQGGPVTGPPPYENKGHSISAGRVETSEQLHPILDRVLRSRPSKADPDLLAYVRRWLHSYMAKLGVDDTNRPFLETGNAPHPPDDGLVAQILAIADSQRIMRELDNMLLERKPINKYGYFVTVLLQRIHGITWQQTKHARAALRVVRAGQAAAAAPEPQQLDLTGEISRIAAGKTLR